MAKISYQHHSGEQTLALLEDLTDLYDEIRSTYDERHEIFSRSSFIDRTSTQAQKAGFELVTASTPDLLVGFSFGLPIAAGSWWDECTPPLQEVLNAAKFSVIELDVREGYRGDGIGRCLLGELLSNREEEFATLASTPESPANAMYQQWGWYKVATFYTPPIMDAMLLPLKMSVH